MSKHFLWVFFALVSLFVAACGEKETVIDVQSIAISQPSAEMEIGETLTLKATVSPSNASYDGITWTSTNPKVASVTTSGLVTALSEGNTTITVMAGGRTASCAITVVKGFVAVTSISLNKTSLEMIEGESETLVATVFPENATDKTVIWTSSNESVVIVKDGTVTAVKEGEGTISAKVSDKTAKCTIVVLKKTIAVESIELDKTILSLVEGDTKTLVATVKPENATDKTITWSSSNNSVATVNSKGEVTALSGGSSIITASAGGVSAECAVTVVVPVSSVTLNKSELTLAIGSNETLVATVNPDNATDKTLVWSSSNTDVAIVDQNGRVSALNKGTAVITVKTNDGFKTATCLITVPSPGNTEPINGGDPTINW